MRFDWPYEQEFSEQVKTFVGRHGVSRNLFARIKFQGGQILVNNVQQNARFRLNKGDVVSLVMPVEHPHETVVPSYLPIEIVYEDAHLLIVNKPAGLASLPSKIHPDDTMANRVKGYYQRQNYQDQVIHIVTRLDRDTSGLMLFAKHSYAHALLDTQLRTKSLHKTYLALVENVLSTDYGNIRLPIARVEGSIMIRTVAPTGKEAWTEYWVAQRFPAATFVKIRLHTGRTHQIRVHFKAIGHVLVGDDLYGGAWTAELKRQALHCAQLDFLHPITGESLTFKQALPADMQAYIMQYE